MVITAVLTNILSAIIIPIITFFFLRKKLGIANAGAVAAAYGSVGAVTFVTRVALEAHNIAFAGHMIAFMAMMKAPYVIMGVLLVVLFSKNNEVEMSLGKLLKHSLVIGSVLLIVGSVSYWFCCYRTTSGRFTTIYNRSIQRISFRILIRYGYYKRQKIERHIEKRSLPYSICHYYSFGEWIINGDTK